MTYDLKPYPTYKDSGVPWLGQVPEHWGALPTRALFAEVNEREYPDEEMLSVTITQGVIRQRTLLEGSSKKDSSNEDRSAYKLVCPGDIAYNKMRAWQGAIGVSAFRGIVSPAYIVVRLRHENNVRYFHHLFRTPQFAKEAERWSYGITSDMWSLRPEHFRMIYSPLPPREEQDAIVRYLDHVDRSIRRYIRTKQKLIKLLEEQKQVIVHRAVTRGLDQNVRLKPSGVEWLGDVPEHWEVAHLRYLVRCLDGKRVPLNSVERGAMQGAYPYWGANKVIDHVNAWLFDEPLVLLGEDGAPFFERGRDVAFFVTGKIWVNNHAHVLRCGRRLEPQFLTHVLNCVDYTAFIDGSTRDKLTQQAMGTIAVQIPPIPEQVVIVEHLSGATEDLNRAIATAERETALLREFQTRLVADVVTGKLDAREAVAGLPDEAEEEAFEEVSEIAGEEEVFEVEEGKESLEEAEV